VCVLKELYKPAISKYESYAYYVLVGKLLQNIASESYPQLRKKQTLVVKAILAVQKELKSRFSAIYSDKGVSTYSKMLAENVSKLKRMELKYKFPFYSSNKKEKILKEERNLCRDLITRSFLMNRTDDNELVERSVEPDRSTPFLEGCFTSANNGVRYFYSLVKVVAKQDEYIRNNVKAILDSNNDELLKITYYSEKLKKCKPYEGFEIYSTGSWKCELSDDKGKPIFYSDLPILCLQRVSANRYYPYEFMVICIDLEIESGGSNEEEAYVRLRDSFDLLFRSMSQDCDNMTAITQALKGEIERSTVWKETFKELFHIGQKKNVLQKDKKYKHSCILGVSDEQQRALAV